MLIVGCGYTGQALARLLRQQGVVVTGTVSAPEHLGRVTATGARAEVLHLPQALHGAQREATLRLIAAHDAIVYAVGPERTTGERFSDHALAFADLLEAFAPAIPAFVYLSSTGVYGDRGGAWVDETTPLVEAAAGPRGAVRIAVERGLLARHAQWGLPVRILRLTGIYGPGRHVGLRLRAGNYRVIEADPPLVVNRIHVADAAQAVVAALAPGREGEVVVVSDGVPATLREVADYAARRMGLPPPPGENSRTARRRMGEANFHLVADSKRCGNRKLVEEWGVRLAFPDYRSGLDQALAADAAGAPE
ncbi:MAG: NAD-dependent epimerase/dehydratase family protein [Nitrospirota bacterium]|nr:NAD-dependent epimerase/dehydratase family protein [Nitrospirota bacterium]